MARPIGRTTPEVSDDAWRQHAACLGEPHSTFFYDEGWLRKDVRAAREARAKAICATCPVTQECLEDTLTYPAQQDEGVRGCTTSDERRQIRRERGQRVGLSTSEKRQAEAS